ncbi:hypothetical protein KIW84_053131 [Lathyrus oleraceus]|uniref:Uncharacterized protein n=1 Tax=Pisum sativum TaxID=3888 RepID=A0A9D4WSD4_PEA|nr:hypothetical protein KIW84_053131 [Pisum sativum]
MTTLAVGDGGFGMLVVLNEGLHSSGTFLVDDGPYYFCVFEILLGRLSKSLYNQALKKISKFVRTNILPGAIAEVGLLFGNLHGQRFLVGCGRVGLVHDDGGG